MVIFPKFLIGLVCIMSFSTFLSQDQASPNLRAYLISSSLWRPRGMGDIGERVFGGYRCDEKGSLMIKQPVFSGHIFMNRNWK